MDMTGILLTAVGLVVTGLALWVQLNSYRLQRRQGTGMPGTKLDAHAVEHVLREVAEDPVRTIAADHIFVEAEKRGVGYIDKKPIGVYLDLHTASCDPRKREALAQSLANFVRDTVPAAPGSLVVASPREGNLLVGARAAELLGAKFLMIRTITAPRFGYPIEGTFTPGVNAVMVDDLCMEGTFLKRCVRSLRRFGVNVSHCVCLFERLDGDARDALTSVAVSLHAKYQIDDDTLKDFRENIPHW